MKVTITFSENILKEQPLQ